MVNKPLKRPYFWGGTLGRGRLTSHDLIPTKKKNCRFFGSGSSREKRLTPTAPGRHGAAPQPHEEDTREGAKSWKERFWGNQPPQKKTTGIMKLLPFIAVDQTQCKKMSPFSCAFFGLATS